MNQENQPTKQPQDDFDLALVAMERAADIARQRAILRDGRLVAWRDGQMVREPVDSPGDSADQSGGRQG